ncbi:hypothetical protein HK097_001349 [Rhizophlyctis rosea]|uniref:Glycosyl transferase 64 domain-containing protein n=1 Tax=Rhizophlyctis rosea TaxID=64517 RepID=A0AAD5S6U5_9FUNG|nr:hypothetical protein HK097_001349 [Rhizophlyctis rosea]
MATKKLLGDDSLSPISIRSIHIRPASGRTHMRTLIITAVAAIALISFFVLARETQSRPASVQYGTSPSPLYPKPPTFKAGKSYTMVVASYEKRIDFLKHLLTKYAGPRTECTNLEEVVVMWISKIQPPEQILQFAAANMSRKVRFVWKEGMTLNDRFHVENVVGGESILSFDDDVRFNCSSVEFGFSVHKSFPDRLVGWVPRLAVENKNHSLEYGFLKRPGPYNLMLTGAAFYHRNHALAYWSDTNKVNRDLIEETWNCEDLLFNYVVAASASWPGGRAPIFTEGEFITEKQKGGEAISTQPGHVTERHKCLNKFRERFGDVLGSNWGLGQLAPIAVKVR